MVEQSAAELGKTVGMNMKLDINTTQVAWAALRRGLDPDGDIKVLRRAIQAKKSGDTVAVLSSMNELKKRLGVYGTLTVQPTGGPR